MWFRIKYLIRLFYTLYDVGFIRLKDRLIHIIKNNLAKVIPFDYLKFIIKGFDDVPEINLFLDNKYTFTNDNIPKKGYEFEKIKFNFLNKEASFSKNFLWNDPLYDRLWIFNLHYFDWSRKWLDELIDNKRWNKDANSLPYLIDYWIKCNNLKSGFGWHSYTIALRIRNWMWLFQIHPNLLSEKRIRAFWNQFCWLNFNQEKFHGGNHYLENLITLIMVGMQFKGKFAQNIVSESLCKLKIELSYQILDDGGHEERSASYHLLMLDRLVELGCFLDIVQNESPSWLRSYIKKMEIWSKSIRLINGKTPLFNDSCFDSYYQIDKVLDFCRAFLSKKCLSMNGLRGHLLTIAFEKEIKFISNIKELKIKKSILHLPQTGWIFLRPGFGWELIFKCGKSCPDHLGAHAHSDLLSFDLFHKGKEIICETATSTYWDLSKRNFERSSSAHNTLQMGKKVKGKFKGVEPIDIWSSFRVGKKANHENLKYGSKKGWLWVQGSHNGFKDLKGEHLRWLTIKIGKDKKPILIIIDSVKLQKDISIESFFHLSPVFNTFSTYSSLNFKFLTSQNCGLKYQDYQGYFSEGFGLRTKRKSLKYSLDLSEGLFAIFTIFSDSSLVFHNSDSSKNNNLSGSLDFGCLGEIMWDIKSNLFFIN